MKKQLRRSLGGLLVVAIVLAAPSAFALDYMKNLMKSLDRFSSAGQRENVAVTLDSISLMAPATEFPEWEALSKKGSAAAKRGDTAALKASCNGCHDKYRDTYKTKYGSGRPPPDNMPKPFR
jgi:hypothetical protein